MRIARRLAAYAPIVLLALAMFFVAWKARAPAPAWQLAGAETSAATLEATAQPTPQEMPQPTAAVAAEPGAGSAALVETPTPLAPGTWLTRGWQTLHTDLSDLVRLGLSLAPVVLIMTAFVGFRLLARRRARRR